MRRFGKKAELVSKGKICNVIGNEYHNEYDSLFANHNCNYNNTYNANENVCNEQYQHHLGHENKQHEHHHHHRKMVRLSYLEEANLYNTLHVNENCTSDEIRNAYKKLCVKYHPDKGGSSSMFQKIQNAYTILMFPLTRRIYDRFGSKSLRIINDIITEDKLCSNPELLNNIDNYDLEDIECYFNLNSNNNR